MTKINSKQNIRKYENRHDWNGVSKRSDYYRTNRDNNYQFVKTHF